jgi:hypothetical protein
MGQHRDASPHNISFDEHSPFTDRTRVSAYAFKLGLPAVESVLCRQQLRSPGTTEFGGAIMQCVAPLIEEAPRPHSRVARHLLHPRLVRGAV